MLEDPYIVQKPSGLRVRSSRFQPWFLPVTNPVSTRQCPWSRSLNPCPSASWSVRCPVLLPACFSSSAPPCGRAQSFHGVLMPLFTECFPYTSQFSILSMSLCVILTTLCINSQHLQGKCQAPCLVLDAEKLIV